MEGVRFFVPRGACASPSKRPPSARSLRCWRLGLGSVALCCASAQHCTDALRWFSITAAARLMVATTGTTVDKYLLVAFFALQAPASGINWMKSDHGLLIASFISLLMRLLHWFFPGEEVLAFKSMLLTMLVTTPSQFITLRESQGRAILSLVIAAYLAFQHFTGVGSLRNAFIGREAIVATLCIICMTIITLMLVF